MASKFDWKSTLSAVAPWIATTLGGPLAGQAVTALEGALGLSAGSGEEAIAQKIASATPADLLALKAADNKHAEIMKQLGYDSVVAIAKLESADLATVNQTLQIELQNSDKEAWYQKAWRPANGFCVAVGSFLGVLAVCYLFYLALVQKDIAALNVIPSLATSLTMILAVPGAAVGIAAWHRGVAQVEEAKKV